MKSGCKCLNQLSPCGFALVASNRTLQDCQYFTLRIFTLKLPWRLYRAQEVLEDYISCFFLHIVDVAGRCNEMKPTE